MMRGMFAAVVVILSFVFPGAAQNGPPDPERIAHELGLRGWSLTTLPRIDAAGEIRLQLPIADREYDVVLTPHSIRAATHRVMIDRGNGQLIEAPWEPITTYRGHIEQAPDAVIAASVRDGQIDAMILLEGAPDEGAWFVQPLARTIRDAGDDLHIIYSAADAPADGHRCGGALPGGVVWPPVQPGGSPGGPEGTLICEIALDADHAFFQQNGASAAATAADIENIINSVSLIYEAEAGVQFAITEIIVRTTNAPYTAGVTSGNLLNQFRNHWNSNHASVQRDIAHLFTGITTSDSHVIGLAWLSVVCNQSLGYAFSRSRYSGTMSRRIGLTAHEIGHNFSAEHCDNGAQPCSPCAIMCSGIGGCGGNSSSLACSAPRIATYASASQCLGSGCSAPSITSQPASRNVNEGDPVSFSISATGSSPLSYRWQHNGADVQNGGGISGAATSTLTINPVLASHAGTYTCIVTNPCGSRASQGATLAVNTCTPPQITLHPAARTVEVGDLVSFTVAATGTAPLSYQWRRDGVNLSNGGGISGATAPTLTINPVNLEHRGSYDCIVSNACGSAGSQSAPLTIGACESPRITAQPSGRSIVQGQAVEFSVDAEGQAPLAYRWQRDGSPLNDGGPISGAATPTLRIDPAAVSHAGEYRCIVSNACGSEVSSGATLTVTVPPVITLQPISRSVCAGQSVVLSVNAAGSAPLAYQWRRNGQNLAPASHLSGINAPTLTIDPAGQSDTGTYTVVVSNAGGQVTSQPATVVVSPSISFTQQPVSRNIPAGQRATFSAVIANAGSAPIYRWQRNGQDLPAGGNPPRFFGTSTPTLTITPVQPGDAGVYTLRVEYICGQITSSAATLTVSQELPSTIAYWRFEEGANGNGSSGDMKSNRPALSEVNSPALDLRRGDGDPRYVREVPGPQVHGVGENKLAMRFDGESALRLSAHELLNFGAVNTASGEFTIEMFVKIDPMNGGSSNYRLLQRLRDDGPIWTGYDMFVGGGSVSALHGRIAATASDGLQSSSQNTPARIDNGEWRHIAWRRFFDGQTARFDVWVDYQLVASAAGSAVTSLANDRDLWIGRGSSIGSSHYLRGWLDEIRISDRPLLPGEFLRVAEGAVCYANCSEAPSQPTLNIDDFVCFIAAFNQAQTLPPEQQISHYANCDGSTTQPVLDIRDFVCFVDHFAAGCP